MDNLGQDLFCRHKSQLYSILDTFTLSEVYNESIMWYVNTFQYMILHMQQEIVSEYNFVLIIEL